MSDYLLRRRAIKNGTANPEAKPKPAGIKPISDKKKATMAADKKERGEEDTKLEKWFKARRKEMVGVCQCGCARKSSKNDESNFRSSCAHIFPKANFESVKYHPLNFVERNVWADKNGSSCHTNMDTQGLDKWPNFADWDDIKEKVKEMIPLLTQEERATKFYNHLEKLVYEN